MKATAADEDQSRAWPSTGGDGHDEPGESENDLPLGNRPSPTTPEEVFSGKKSATPERASSGPEDAQVVLTRGTANLYWPLCKQAGSRGSKCTAPAPGLGYRPGEPIQDQPCMERGQGSPTSGILVDSTWGAGSVKREQVEKRFDTTISWSPATMLVFSHSPRIRKSQFFESRSPSAIRVLAEGGQGAAVKYASSRATCASNC